MSDQTEDRPIFDPVYKGDNRSDPDRLSQLPTEPPPWRKASTRKEERAKTFQARPQEIELVNTALYLRRPLLVTGKPGSGKTSLAYAVAYELGLGEVLYWPITTRTTLKDGLYLYDAIARLQDVGEGDRGNFDNIGDYIRLGPLGTALLPSDKPRALVVDEIDKSDIDLPNDLLYVFEEGEFEIPELVRIEQKKSEVTVRTAYKESSNKITGNDTTAMITGGKISSDKFPLMILTSNGERDFPPPFLRRCVRLSMAEPGEERLEAIVKAHLRQVEGGKKLIAQSEALIEKLIGRFVNKRNERNKGDLATDQLLNAIYLVTQEISPHVDDNIENPDDLIEKLWKHLSSSEDQQSDSSQAD